MFLVLLPYLAFRLLAFTFGELPELLFTRRSPEKRREEYRAGLTDFADVYKRDGMPASGAELINRDVRASVAIGCNADLE